MFFYGTCCWKQSNDRMEIANVKKSDTVKTLIEHINVTKKLHNLETYMVLKEIPMILQDLSVTIDSISESMDGNKCINIGMKTNK